VINDFYFDFSIVQEETDCSTNYQNKFTSTSKSYSNTSNNNTSRDAKKENERKQTEDKYGFKGKLNTEQKRAQFHSYEEAIEKNTE